MAEKDNVGALIMLFNPSDSNPYFIHSFLRQASISFEKLARVVTMLYVVRPNLIQAL